MTIREYVCDDCGRRKHQTGVGPKRVRCDECKRKRDAARKRRAKSTLVVAELPTVEEAPVSPPVPAPPLPAAGEPGVVSPGGPVRRAVDDVLAALDVVGGPAPALRAMAQALADTMDIRPDLRASASRELREVLTALFPDEEVVDVDGNFLAAMSAPVRDASA